jgi:Ca2+-binding EF-hand superfamily protein
MQVPAHESFASELRNAGYDVPGSPMKPSARAAQRKTTVARPPLLSLLNKAEAKANARPSLSSQSPQHRKLMRSPYAKNPGQGGGFSNRSRAHAAEPVQPKKRHLLPQHVRTHVLTLFRTFAASDATLRMRSGARVSGASIASSALSSAAAAAAAASCGRHRVASAGPKPTPLFPPVSAREGRNVASAPSRARTQGQPPQPPQSLSFEEVLRLYYRNATPLEIDAMLALVESTREQLLRRRWICEAKAQHLDRIRQAFLMGDENGDGVLSLAEFREAVAVHNGQRLPGGAAPAQGQTGIPPEELEAIFARADADGSGTLDEDEFITLVASHPKLMSSFEAIIDAGIGRKLREEEKKLAKLFKAPISPRSRSVVSPSGRKRRASLNDLRSFGEVRLPMATEE